VCGRGWHSHVGGYSGGEQHGDTLEPGQRPGLPEGLSSQRIPGKDSDIFIYIFFTRKYFRLQQEKLLKGGSHQTKSENICQSFSLKL